MVGSKKLNHFQDKNPESFSSPIEFKRKKVNLTEMQGPQIKGLKLKKSEAS